MSFFKKMKERLFKSSSKLDEGLDAIIDEAAEEVETEVEQPAERPDAQPPPAPSAPRAVSPPEAPAEAAPAAREPQALTPTSPVQAPEPEVQRPQPEPVPDRAAPTPPEPVAATELTPEPEPDLEPDLEPQPLPTDPVPEPQAAQIEETNRPGLFGRMLGRRTVTVKKRILDDEMLESLEELLITADMGVDTALKLSARLAEGRFGRALSTDEIKSALSTEIAQILAPVARPLPLYAKRPQVVLVVGVNGSGKTTTIGKLASQLKSAGKSVVIAAGDTFRAAAVEQLQVWGQRAGVPVMTAEQGSDPASLAFDAMVRAETDGADILLIDTAGRLQNRADLMEELAKIVRVIRKKDPEAPHNTVLVLDATTGQNALSQVEIFQKIADVSGLVMTKLDGTAKGGVLVALADRFALPIHAIGVGEAIDDLAPFEPEDFADALTGRG
ncbi:MAG: signal recognition particle-docking protein FtsY [Pseudomonadota bacterium]